MPEQRSGARAGAGWVCRGPPALPLPVKPPWQRSTRDATGRVTLSRINPLFLRTEPSSEQEEEGSK